MSISLSLAQEQYINIVFNNPWNKAKCKSAKLNLGKFCKKNGYDFITVLYDAIDMLELKLGERNE